MITRMMMRWDVPQTLPKEGERAVIATLMVQGLGQGTTRPTTLTIGLEQDAGRWHITHDGEAMEGYQGYADPMQALYEAFGSFCDEALPELAKLLTRELAKKIGYEEVKK